jgi:hypothetical protein
MELSTKSLNDFAKKVVSNARRNLTSRKKNVTRKLHKSIRYEIIMKDGKMSLFFRMEDYGQYQDLGVKGANPSKIKNGKQKAPNSPFKFGSGRGKGSLRKALDRWIVKKGIAPRGAGGKFMSREGIKYAMAKSIYFQGIKPSYFFKDAVDKAYDKFPNEIVEFVGRDIEGMLFSEIDKVL